MWPNHVQVLAIAVQGNVILFLFQPQTLYAQVESHSSKLRDVHGGRIPPHSSGGVHRLNITPPHITLNAHRLEAQRC